ncbi:MAG: exodeoxyribonuclease VII large subunit [Opitutales bacterium]|nr:exodeoxyribonuclease VII large subunit [Opitutales bacterium]
MQRNPEEILSVSALTGLLRELVEPAFSQVWVVGEVSNFRRQDSGHCYFTLKDEGAQLPAVLFRQSARSLQTPLRDGLKVLAFGRMNIYPPSGRYQLVCQHILPAGEGALRERFENLRRKLEAEGLFAAERKKTLPALPRNVGIITSPSGAALRDFLSILSRRGWRGRVIVLPARVQGAEAAGEIVAMMKNAVRFGTLDTLVLARGGGSLEDLWPFNEEIVARAVAACPLPTISAVGHETDFTLSDFAADRRAETPSAAAELLSSLRMDALDRVVGATEDMERITELAFERARARVELAKIKLSARSPQRQIEHSWLKIDELATRLRHATNERMRGKAERLDAIRTRLETCAPQRRLEMAQQRLEQLALRLESASPQSVIKRGFAILRRADGEIVSDGASLGKGERIELELRDGKRGARVD